MTTNSPPTWEFDKDGILLSELLRNGRVSLNALASRMQEYRQKLWRRQKELEGDVIWGYGAVIDETKVGWRKYLVKMMIGGKGRGSTEGLGDDASDWVSLRTLSSYIVDAPDHNYVMEIACRTPFDLERYLRTLREALGNQLQGDIEVNEIMFSVRQGGFANPDIERLQQLLRSLHALSPVATAQGDDGL